ncbi:hypothetical protein G5714_005751 [Onychostoma macrolepis]|uniref:Immunoglobulin domain-containing protein n=1 Tax=Onychostoma macrolepis TaxID=369639 RepID=A0A7J6D1Y1_9TELE|nr:hypothetical protein G5714_005751 [Onychostoma macrolepis]
MKVSITSLIALSCIYWKVSGTLMEVVVRPGDNATLLCNCEIVTGQEIRWVKICSLQIQPPLIISAYNSLLQPIPRFSVFWNSASKSYDLVIENITGADLGLYYCSRVEKKYIKQNGIIFEKDVYHTGDTLIKLTYGSPVLKESEGRQSRSETQRQLSQEQDVHTEVFYTSLNIPKRGCKRIKSSRLQSSDFSVYDGIKMHA